MKRKKNNPTEDVRTQTGLAEICDQWKRARALVKRHKGRGFRGLIQVINYAEQLERIFKV